LNVVAIILARAGSKGIPNKNIINFCGKPLLSWSIEQAKKVKEISSVWVSSDSDAILNVAKTYGANTINRPPELSGDTVTSELAWIHAVDEIEKKGQHVDLVVALQATSPLREASDMEKALQNFKIKQCDSMFSCSELKDFLIWESSPEGVYRSINYDYQNRKRRQEFSKQYVENGSFYIFKPEVLKNYNNRFGGKIEITTMEFWKTFEIDDMEDLRMCEVLMMHYLLNKREKFERD